MSPCTHFCQDQWVFPKKIANRPGLDRIHFRIGTYADFREMLIKQLNKNPVLSNWTHREPDDPGIALLEGAALLGDILTFYQEQYANEAYLRTAAWREDIADLVRLLGYRLSPGLGGKSRFAFTVKGAQPLIIPTGFPIQAQLETIKPPVDFETSQEIKACSELSQFSLFQPLINPDITLETKEFYLEPADAEALALKAGDRLMIYILDDWLWPRASRKAEMVVVESLRKFHQQTVIKIKGALRQLDNLEKVDGFKLGRTFNHFGHNAPPTSITFDNTTSPASVSAYPSIDYTRRLNSATTAWVKPSLQPTQVPLDREVNDLSAGANCICQVPLWQYWMETNTPPVNLILIRKISEIQKNDVQWGSLTGSSTVLNLGAGLMTYDLWQGYGYNRFDIRQFQLHETLGPQFTLRALPELDTSSARGKIFYFYGSETAALALKDRPLIIPLAEEQVMETSCTSVESLPDHFSQLASAWKIGLSTELDYVDFPHEKSPTVVYGNIADATQGKTEKTAFLGNGDSRQIFQTFKLPKAPITYLNDPDVFPPEKPEMDIYVNEIKWQWVTTLFGRGPKEEIYIVREDEDGVSWVQFGDGQTGSRLPSGLNNVKAIYRTGMGATGKIKAGATPQPGSVLTGLDKIHMPIPAGFGSQPETGAHAKETAPGKFQSLGRLVSLRDFEKTAQSIAGVLKARATWALEQNTSLIRILALMGSGHAVKEVQELMTEYNQSQGPDRFPIRVNAGKFTYVYVSLTIGMDSRYQEDLVEAAIKTALGVTGEEGMGIDNPKGLLGLSSRTFGQEEYANRIAGVVQNVAGINWVEVKTFDLLGEAPQDDPSLIPQPDPTNLHCWEIVRCQDSQILALYKDHCKIQFTQG